MNRKDADDLVLQRTQIQQQMQLARQNYSVQFNVYERRGSHFPRSATMRFLTGKNNLQLIANIIVRVAVDSAVRKLCIRYPSTISITHKLRHLFLKS